MGTLYVGGLGPGNYGHITTEVWEKMQGTMPIYLRTEIHPTVEFLKSRGITFSSFDYLYEEKSKFEDIYQTIVEKLVDFAKQEDILYLVPGSPLVAERTVRLLHAIEEKNVKLCILPGMSFLEVLYTHLHIDPIEGIYIGEAQQNLENLPINVQTIVLTQLYNQRVASEVKLSLMEHYEDDKKITVVHHLSLDDEKIDKIHLYQLDRLTYIDHLTSLVIEKESELKGKTNLESLTQVMATLRSKDGCPWDKEQNHLSLRRYLLEECYEVLEAIDEENMENLCEELGDLLWQVVFHSQLAKERGDFSLEDVIACVYEKMIRRHPHVFDKKADITTKEVNELWETIKKSEKNKKNILDNIPKSLPALLRAQKMQEKASKVGFDWDSVEGAWQKFEEEIEEFKEAVALKSQKDIEDEAGDILFSLLNVIRWYKIVAESALTSSSNKFQRRFEFVEAEVLGSGKSWQELSLKELDSFWDKAKELECTGVKLK